MGATQAAGFAEAVAEGDLSLAQAVAWHLQSNHYPPVPTSMVRPCLEAIEAVDAGELDHEVELPEGITFRGRSSCGVWDIVEGHHLHSFLSVEEA